MRPLLLVAPALAAALACASGRPDTAGPVPTPKADSTAAVPPAPAEPRAAVADPKPAAPAVAPSADSVRRVAPPDAAYARGWMPLASTGSTDSSVPIPRPTAVAS